MKKSRKLEGFVFFNLAVVFMTVIFVTFYFSESPWRTTTFQNDSEMLVIRKLTSNVPLIDDIKFKGGFLYAEEGDNTKKLPGIYTSQVGLQGLILNSLQKTLGTNTTDFIAISRIMVAALFALTVGGILYKAWTEFGVGTSVITLLLVISSFWLVAFSKNLYWVAFTLLLPFTAGWLIYPKVIHAKMQFRTFWAIISILIFLKSLNGYEYVTNTILGATIGPMYYELMRRTKASVLIKLIILICLAGVGGFLLAYGLHFFQLYAFVKDIREAAYILTDRAVIRTLGINPYMTACDNSNYLIVVLKYLNSQSVFRLDIPLVWMFSTYAIMITTLIPIRTKTPTSILLIVFAILLIILSLGVDYFVGKPGVGITQILVLSGGICILIFGILSLTNIILPRPEKLVILAYSTTWALFSSFSWVVLARNHMACHLHLNPIVFYLPFGVTFFLFLGFWIETLARTFYSHFCSAPI